MMNFAFRPVFGRSAFLLLVVAGPSLPAATVTVNPAGGAEYTTLQAAVDNIGAWGDGEDTIRLVNGSHAIEQTVNISSAAANGGLIIEAAPGALPVLIPGNTVEEMIRLDGGEMRVVIDGLAVVGPTIGGRSDNISAVTVRGSAAADLTVRNCLFTANNGANQPVTDYLGYADNRNHPAQPWPDSERIRHGVSILGGNQVVDIKIEQSVFFATQRAAVVLEGDLAPGSGISMDGCLVIMSGDQNIYLTGQQAGVEFAIRGSCIIPMGYDGTSAILLRGTGVFTPFAGSLSIEDTIIHQALRGAVNLHDSTSTVNIARCTFRANNADMINISGSGAPPKPAFNIADSIFWTGDSFIRFPAFTPDPFTSFAFDYCAIVGGKLLHADQDPSVQAALEAAYDGNGPLILHHPGFRAADLDFGLAGLRSWDSASNPFFDVTSPKFGGMGSGGSDLAGGGEYIGPIAVPTPPPTVLQEVEHFDIDPEWDERNNHLAPDPCPTITQNFGYSGTTSHAGSTAGEIGGRINRSVTPAWYAKMIEPKTFEDSFSVSGKFAVTQSSASSGFMFGWFNSQTPGGFRTANSLLMVFDGNPGTVGSPSVAYCTSQWSAGGGTRFDSVVLPANGAQHSFSISYDPDGGAGRGEVRFTLDNVVDETYPLGPFHRSEGVTFDRFGLFNPHNPGDFTVVYFDDLVIDGEVEDFSTDPGWEGEHNTESYTDCRVGGLHDFGFSPSEFAGGPAGEMGGLVWRSTSEVSYYAAPLGPFTLDDELFVSGRIALTRGHTDADGVFGFFNSGVQTSSDGIVPTSFLGVVLGAPSRVGHYFRPIYRTADSGMAAQAIDVGVKIKPDGAVHDWTLHYSPEGNRGEGRIELTLDGVPQFLSLAPGHRAAGATFDRFGIVISGQVGGSLLEYFLDDLSYTVGVPNAAGHWTHY